MPAPPLAKRLAHLGIVRDEDAVLHLPLRYEDYTRLTPLARLAGGQTVCCEGVVANCEIKYKPRRQLVCLLKDDKAALVLRYFTFYPSLQKLLAEGRRVRVFGEVRGGFFGYEMIHPKTQLSDPAKPLPTSLTPIYPTTAGLSQEVLTRHISAALQRNAGLNELLPTSLIKQEGLWEWRHAITFLHAPPPKLSDSERYQLDQHTHPAWQRIKFDELLAQQLSLKLHRQRRARYRATPLPGNGQLTGQLFARLPFKLTHAQTRVWREIADDLARQVPMNRLLQGDVGSGKTVIAALAALRTLESGRQVALMAPTEILAEQHYRKLSLWLKDMPVKLVWLSGAMTAAAKREAAAQLASDEPLLAVGTHALFQQTVALPQLGLAIVDEQHRFGVAQRLALRQKGSQASSHDVHQLMMSATPIPRTLAMSFYADLDVSLIDELPPGRTPVTTRLVSQSKRATIIAHVGKRCAEGAQTYWVCPLVEESEKVDLLAAQTLFEELTAAYNGKTLINGVQQPQLKVGLLHGKMKSHDKAAVMEAFVKGEIQVLVATTVVEVGVDVANASTMVIEHAERFGLAQLHQLRGRVGRGRRESQCILLYEAPLGELARARLKAIYESSDGFAIANEDLHLRGPGELLGARQAGIPLLRYADLFADEKLLEHAARVANQILARADGEDVATAIMNRWLGDKSEFFKA